MPFGPLEFELNPGILLRLSPEIPGKSAQRIILYPNKARNLRDSNDELDANQPFMLISAERFKLYRCPIQDEFLWEYVFQVLVDEKIRWFLYQPSWHKLTTLKQDE